MRSERRRFENSKQQAADESGTHLSCLVPNLGKYLEVTAQRFQGIGTTENCERNPGLGFRHFK